MAFQQGLSGLNASARALDVISSNVANAATVGFKSSSTVFADTFASAMGGGISNLQVGMGGNTLAVRQSFTQGATTASNNPLDMAIGGNGFFVIQRTNGTQAYSRNGQFDLDKDGYIINPLGERLQGYQSVDANGGVAFLGSTTARAIQVPPQGIGAKATSDALAIRGNLDSDEQPKTNPFVVDDPTTPGSAHNVDTYNFTTSATVYDSLGEQHNLSMYFVKSATANEWDVYYEFDGNAMAGQEGPFPITFDANGKFTGGSPIPVTVDATTVLNDKADTITFDLDLSQFTQNSAASGVFEITQNGSPPGELAGVSVSASGVVQGRYTNGETRDLGQVILATFRNPNGLISLGDNLWAESIDSGQPAIGAPGAGLNGSIGSGRVEESNVDMSTELVNMIIQQRNYQANAQSIKTQDQILQTLINLR